MGCLHVREFCLPRSGSVEKQEAREGEVNKLFTTKQIRFQVPRDDPGTCFLPKATVLAGSRYRERNRRGGPETPDFVDYVRHILKVFADYVQHIPVDFVDYNQQNRIKMVAGGNNCARFSKSVANLTR